tara:strand:- start:3741 stop:4763 length:1023 start_codon:yes stop_codon:yes gene_type:complete
MNKLFIISNESIFINQGKFFCDNIDMKSTSEGLNNKFEVNIIARESKKIRSHKINLKNVKIYGNIISFLFGILKASRNKNSKYLIISISPFTMLACILLNLLKEKPNVYLRSDGYEEYKSILGFLGPAIYHMMFLIVGKISHLISCREHILRGRKGNIVEPSQLTKKWLFNHKPTQLDKIKLLYVGRVRVEKGIFSLLKIFKKISENITLSIVGAEKVSNKTIVQNNVNIYEIETNEDNLIKFYDDHDIFILPSFTEGHPMALLESLARFRPVIIFKEIDHVLGNKKGVFVANRDEKSLFEKIKYIESNYENIQREMKENKLPLKENFLKQMEKSILNSN